ncbi:MAG: hypothetical protein Q8P11_00450 [bacterium]|nr:hypothetical protein [bacterium]
MQPTKINFIIGITACVLVLATIIVGLVTVGTPGKERARLRDQQRVNDLGMLENDIISFWQAKRTLPSSLTSLNDATRSVVIPTDPQTKESYQYITASPLQFQLCATFETKGDGNNYYGRDESWAHEIGTVCFDRTIDPDFYPPFDGDKDPMDAKIFIDGKWQQLSEPIVPAPGETVPVR